MSDREHEVERLFRGLLELGEGVDCDAYLCRECRSDESVRRRVKALVRAYRGAGDFLEEDVVGERLDGAGVGLAGRRVAGYRVLRLVSGGASCVVYLAEQLEPVRRPVALKLSRPGEGVERARIRFAAERQAMAVLDHPNVVQLYDAGDWEGLPFIVSEWVGGESLLEYAERGQLGVGARVELFLQACLGVVHGHERGVVHRDIKPANILVTEREGVALVKVIDFGVSGASGHELGGGEGTPGYMSPEQLVRGVGAADVREDVYGLGVILHELLTGRRPRVEPGVGWVIEQDRGDSGLLVELERWMAGGLEGVLRRALAWEREGRYGSVMELVGDLRELLGAIRDGESRGGLALLLRRHRGWVAVAGVIAGVGLAWLAQVVWESDIGRWGWASGAVMQRQREVEAMGRSDITEAMYWVTRGQDGGVMEGIVGGMGRGVARPVRFVQVDGLVRVLGFSPSGERVVILLESGECWVWDWEADEYVFGGEGWSGVVSVGWAGGADLLAVGRADGVVEVWDVGRGERVMGVEVGEGVGVVSFGGGGRYLAVANRELRIWDLEQARWLGEGWEHPEGIYGVEFSAGGDRVVTACEDGRARVFRVGGGGGALVFVGEYPHARRVEVESAELCCENALIETDLVVPLLVGEDGVLTWSGLGRVSYWEDGRELGVVSETCHATRMARSGGGEWMAVALRKGGVGYWRAVDVALETGRRVEHGERVFDVDFDVGRGRFLTASADRTVGVWDLETGRLEYPLMKHAREVVHGDISADGRRVVTAQLDGQVRLWVLPERGLFPGKLWDGELVEVESVVGGGVLARVGEKRGDLVWLRVAGGEVVWERLGVEGGAASACEENGALAVVRTDAVGGRLEVMLGDVRVESALAFVPEGVAWVGSGLLVVADNGGSLWKVRVGEGGVALGSPELVVKSVMAGGGGRFEISGGGGYVVCWRGRELAGVFELGTGMSCWGWGGGGGRQVSMSPVEDVCLVVEAGDVARVCGLKDGRSLGADLKHAGGILRHAFSEDGVWVATAGHDGRMLVWDWRRGELVCPPLVHGEEVVNFVFGGDGTWVATLSRAGVVRVWSTEHGFLLSPDWGGLELGASAELVDWGGNLLVVAGVRGWVWEMGDGEGWGDGVSREEAGLAGEVLSGLGGERGELLGSGAWAERVERLRGAWPAWFRVVRGG